MKEIIALSKEIREQYHALERVHHGTEWTIEEDALAFLTDAGLVGRLTMAEQGRWYTSDSTTDLRHKLGECVWWLAVLAERMNIDLEEVVADFLHKTKDNLNS